jgi:hypothetical protein
VYKVLNYFILFSVFYLLMVQTEHFQVVSTRKKEKLFTEIQGLGKDL